MLGRKKHDLLLKKNITISLEISFKHLSSFFGKHERENFAIHSLITLGGIADQFSVSPEQLRKWNGLKTAKVSRGMVLRVYTIGGEPEAIPVRKRSSGKKKSSGVKTASAASRRQKTP